MNKKISKNLASLILVLIMALSGTVPASAIQFSDTGNHWAGDIIEKWSEYGIVSGSNGKYRPNDLVTRAEFASMLNQVMKYANQGGITYKDIQQTDWFYDAIMRLSAAGVMQGADGKAMPKSSIKRQEAAVMIARALHIKEISGSTSFTDDPQIAEWAKGYVKALASSGIVTGMPNGDFNPTGNLTRAEAVAILNKGIEGIFDKPDEYSQEVQGNLVVNTADVCLNSYSAEWDSKIR